MAEQPKFDKFLSEARKRFLQCEEAERDVRSEALDDLRFRKGDQWPEKVRADRDRDFRPCLTINVLPARERQILNDQRQNRPAIHVNPVDDKADPDTAEILQGIVRHIEYDSNADVAYDTAMAAAVRGGFGYIEVCTEYETPLSFNQVIKIKRIRNAFSVYYDPNAQEPDYSDGRYAFKFAWLTKEEFKREYPDSELTGLDDWSTIGDQAPGWLQQNDSVRVAEYWYIEEEKVTIWQDKDGQVQQETKDQKAPEGAETRETKVPKVKWCKINGVEKLEETDWAGKWIPIIPVLGDELEVDGKRVLEGMIRHTKDPIRMQNYMASAEVEAIALAPKAPWVVAAGQVENYKALWQQANSRNLAFLPYDPKDIAGTPVPPPGRNTAEPAIAAITQARLQFADDLKAVTGIYDAQLGQRSNEVSGTAIGQRKQQGELSNFHYVDNLTRAIRHLGRIVIDLIPHIYDTPRVLRIIGEDGTQDTAAVNQQVVEQGVTKIYDLTVGTYDVTVKAGPSYQTKRQEAADSMIQMTKAYPQLFAVAGDQLAKNLDWPGARELADRIQRWINMTIPGLIDDEQNPIPPEAQMAIAKAKQEGQALNALCQHLEQQLQQMQAEKQAKVVENDAKLAIEKLHSETQILVAEIGAKSQEAMTRIKMEQQVWQQIHGDAHDLGLQAQQQAADQQSQAQDQAAQQQQQDSQQQHEAGMADLGHSQALEQQQQAADLAPEPAAAQ